MPLDLDGLEQRVVGVLIEKEMSVPESYPLTLNALLAGCNQKSNREPRMEVETYELEGALRALMDRSWVQQLDKEGGRTLRYAHGAKDQLGVEAPDLAILAELLCRGPQTPGELKTRCARMHEFASPAEVEARLHALAERPVPYVSRLPRRAREHAPRWRHLLGRPTEDGEAETEGAPTTETSPPPPPPPRSGETAGPPAAALASRLAELEATVADLRRRIERLEAP